MRKSGKQEREELHRELREAREFPERRKVCLEGAAPSAPKEATPSPPRHADPNAEKAATDFHG